MQISSPPKPRDRISHEGLRRFSPEDVALLEQCQYRIWYVRSRGTFYIPYAEFDGPNFGDAVIDRERAIALLDRIGYVAKDVDEVLTILKLK